MEAGLVVGGKYHVVRLIAEGGMGAVYDAVHGRTGRRVALKLINERGLSRGAGALRRFEREAKAAGAIDSPHVVQVLDAGEDEASGVPFLVMEFLEGHDLRALLARGPLPVERALAIASEVCAGLVEAHAAEIVHRDLKPANLFLAESGGRSVVKILDFGIAKLLDEPTVSGDVTRTGDTVGSPPYMSPEQLASPRDVDHRTDIWSLGVVLYEMLSGVTPTAGSIAIGARVYAICHVPAPPLAGRVDGIRADVAALVHRALAIDPAARFASAKEMLDALSALSAATALPGADLRARPAAASRWAAVGAFAVALALLPPVVAALWRDAPTRAGGPEVGPPSLALGDAAPPEKPAPTAAAATPAAASTGALRSGPAPRAAAGGARKVGGAARAKAVDAPGGGHGGAAAPLPLEATGREQL